jgi:hypothetical protein
MSDLDIQTTVRMVVKLGPRDGTSFHGSRKAGAQAILVKVDSDRHNDLIEEGKCRIYLWYVPSVCFLVLCYILKLLQPRTGRMLR